MNVHSFTRSAATLAVGYALGAALLWALLNVPESNALALTLSAVLLLLVAVTVGVTTASAMAFAQDVSPGVGVRRTLAALPSFVAGLAVFAILWWLTGFADGWWRAHHGAVDALFLRYLGATRTQPVHQAAFRATWLVRWVLGLSIVAGLTAAGAQGGMRLAGSGLRLSVRLAPLAAAAVGILVVSEGLWRIVVWRPKSLPPNWAEPTFATAKLIVLYALTVAIAAAVLRVYGRAAVRMSCRPSGLPS